MKKRFRGSYALKIDDRGRIKVPSRYLSILENHFGSEVYITSINGDHVLLYPLRVWESMEQGFEKIKFRNQTLESFIRLTSFWGTESEIDPRGRVLIPPDIREKSQLKDEILIVGQFDHMVIWNREKFVSQYISKPFSEKKMNEVSQVINEFSTLSRHE